MPTHTSNRFALRLPTANRQSQIANARGGFTLVELLVVIGIIAVLISILLPSLQKARGQATMVTCQSQMKDIGNALLMYSIANRGSLPMGQVYLSGGTGADTDWQRLILPYIKNGASTDYATGSRITKVFRCKEMLEKGDLPSYVDPESVSGYSAHRFLFKDTNIGITAPNTPSRRMPYKLSKLKRGYELVLIWDAIQDLSPASATWGSPVVTTSMGYNAFFSTTLEQQLNPATRWGANPPAGPNKDPISTAERDAQSCWVRWRHNKNTTANFLFGDGHVAPLRWKSNGEGGSGYGGSELTWSNIMPDNCGPNK